VVWMIFNIGIALLLMELGLFEVLEKVLGLYSNVAIAWIGAIVADLVINKPLGLSPKIIEFKRAYLFNINPVGVGSMAIASLISILAFIGLFGDLAQSYSSIIALFLALILSPTIAWITKGKYYIARENDFYDSDATHKHCKPCNLNYEIEDMAYCPHHDVNIYSLCCSLDALCHDACKEKTAHSHQQKLESFIHRFTGDKCSPKTILRLMKFIAISSTLFFLVGIISWLVFSIQTENMAQELISPLKNAFKLLSIIIGILMTVISWWILLLQESANRAEQDLEKQNQTLGVEVKTRRLAEEKAEAATLAKSEFLANMSHEIRTPMNGIIGMSHLVLLTQLNDKQKNYIQKIDDSAKSLLEIINDILDFSKIEAGKLNIEKIEFDLFKTIDGVINIVEFKAHEKNLEIIVSYDSKIGKNFYGDSLRISQILSNLMSNAIKFTSSGEVGIYVQKTALENIIRFEVKDTGIGLSK
jgi:signal transduction histidine kinase